MSNNKQSMKLYTEEQVKSLVHQCRIYNVPAERFLFNYTPIELPSDSLCINCDESKSTHNVCIDCMIKIGKENIELPSDEEIQKISQDINGVDLVNICGILEYKAFNRGAKWMRDKIQGGNK